MFFFQLIEDIIIHRYLYDLGHSFPKQHEARCQKEHFTPNVFVTLNIGNESLLFLMSYLNGKITFLELNHEFIDIYWALIV